MAVVLFSQLQCPEVRALLDISFTEEMIPDEVILLDTFSGSAERDVRSADPLIETRTDAELARLRAATVYFTAANMVVAIPQLISEHIGGFSYQLKSYDTGDKMQELTARGEQELAAVLSPATKAELRPPMFSLASGFRGRST